MTKRAELDPKKAADIYSKTESETDPQGQPKDEVKSHGVGLRESEWQQIEAIADEMGITKHAVAAYALRYFLKSYDAGEIKTETKQSLPGIK